MRADSLRTYAAGEVLRCVCVRARARARFTMVAGFPHAMASSLMVTTLRIHYFLESFVRRTQRRSAGTVVQLAFCDPSEFNVMRTCSKLGCCTLDRRTAKRSRVYRLQR